jgi:hypothetical protein
MSRLVKLVGEWISIFKAKDNGYSMLMVKDESGMTISKGFSIRPE